MSGTQWYNFSPPRWSIVADLLKKVGLGSQHREWHF